MKMLNKKVRGIGGGLLLCLTLSLLLLVTGCRSQKGTTQGMAPSDRELFERIEEQALPFHTLSARLNVDLNLPDQQLSSRVELKMVRDSAFQLSIQPIFGIEMFRLHLTTDSIKILDRMNKRYMAENYENLRGQTPVEFNYYNLQALFLGRLFLPGHQTVTPKLYPRFQVNREGSFAELRTSDAMDLQYAFRADGEGKLLSTIVSDPTQQYGLHWRYADYRLTNEHPFPGTMDIDILSKGASVGGSVIRYSRIRTDEPVNLDFSVPAKYQRITFAQIIRTISNLKQ